MQRDRVGCAAHASTKRVQKFRWYTGEPFIFNRASHPNGYIVPVYRGKPIRSVRRFKPGLPGRCGAEIPTNVGRVPTSRPHSWRYSAGFDAS